MNDHLSYKQNHRIAFWENKFVTSLNDNTLEYYLITAHLKYLKYHNFKIIITHNKFN